SVCCITHSSQLMVNPWLTIRPSCLNRPAEEPTDGVRHLRFDRLDRGAGPAPPARHLLDVLVEHLFVLDRKLATEAVVMERTRTQAAARTAPPDSSAPPTTAEDAAAMQHRRGRSGPGPRPRVAARGCAPAAAGSRPGPPPRPPPRPPPPPYTRTPSPKSHSQL